MILFNWANMKMKSGKENSTASEKLILIDKPKGPSSFDVIRVLRKKLAPTPMNIGVSSQGERGLGVKKMGHAGTLDPLASGLLLVAVGNETKKLTELIGLPKVYEADILLGEKRTTGDLEGEIIEEADVSNIKDENIKKVAERMSGIHSLPVPLYSAVKVNGKPLYWYARLGKSVEVPVKDMEVKEFKVKSIKEKEEKVIVSVEMLVASGTYVRAIAEEFGRKLGVPATTASLRRTKIGEYDVKDAMSI